MRIRTPLALPVILAGASACIVGLLVAGRALEERNDTILRLASDLESLQERRQAALQDQLDLVRWGGLARETEPAPGAPFPAAIEALSPENRFAVIDKGRGAGIRRGVRVRVLRKGSPIGRGLVEAVATDRSVIRILVRNEALQIGDQILEDRLAPEPAPSTRLDELQARFDRFVAQGGASRIETAWLRQRILEEAGSIPETRLRDWVDRTARRLEAASLTLEDLENLRDGFKRARLGDPANEPNPYEAIELYLQLQSLADHCAGCSSYQGARYARQELERFAENPASMRVRETLRELKDRIGKMDPFEAAATLEQVANRLRQIGPDDLGR